MELHQERKYDAIDGKIVNRSTGKPIPDDEPIIIFRAKDRNTTKPIKEFGNKSVLEIYQRICEDENHREVIQGRIDDFNEFQQRFPEVVKEPDSSPHCLK